ncbi:MAG: hypothetical protein NTV52_17670 [Acidobacteria bacterium]|nr:hypothetical protein [Acidobacteriota bacterium]
MDWFWNEFRWIARRLSGAPMFTGITLLTLAVGIGANTAIFSVVNGVLLKPLPYSEAERLLAVGLTAPGVGITDLPLSPSTYFALREEGQSFENFGLWKDTAVTQGILPTLRVQLQLAEPSAPTTTSQADRRRPF